jgi:hypothetical protein
LSSGNCKYGVKRYHPAMARILVLLLIALLPLRGWTAQRMVYGTQAPQTVAVAMPMVMLQEASVESVDIDMAMSPDCAAMHGAPSPDAHGAGHEGCHFCQLCMPLAGLDNAPAIALGVLPHARPQVVSRSFVSAETAHDVKPPIL